MSGRKAAGACLRPCRFRRTVKPTSPLRPQMDRRPFACLEPDRLPSHPAAENRRGRDNPLPCLLPLAARGAGLVGWTERITSALDYIELDVPGEVRIARAAEIACCSQFYLWRPFPVITSISLSEYVRRRRQPISALQTARLSTSLLSTGMILPTRLPRLSGTCTR